MTPVLKQRFGNAVSSHYPMFKYDILSPIPKQKGLKINGNCGLIRDKDKEKKS
jgi:adenine C2-methylase RlmN of 23S rRNA A2503 and tRNA A37